MNNQELITYHTAKLAKEKGFDVPVLFAFDDEDGYLTSSYVEDVFNPINYNSSLHKHSKPTKEELKTWLRKEHNIDVTVSVDGEIDLYVKDSSLLKTYTARVDNWNIQWSVHDGTGLVMPEHYHFEGSNYNDAFEQGLYKALELI